MEFQEKQHGHAAYRPLPPDEVVVCGVDVVIEELEEIIYRTVSFVQS